MQQASAVEYDEGEEADEDEMQARQNNNEKGGGNTS
jgi:hypothetical protein